MTDSKLKVLVTEAVALDREIAEKSDRLKALKEQLGHEAASRVEQAESTEGGGRSIVFEGDDGCIARVVSAGATLKSTIKAEGRDIEKVKRAASRHFTRLFETVTAFRPIANFREEATSLLGAKEGAKLVKLVTNPGKTSVSFETKEAAAGGA